MAICLDNDHYDGPSVYGHLINTGTIGRAIAPQVGGDPCICHLGGVLHDIGAVTNGRDKHHIVGAGMAVRILRYLGCDEQLIDAVRCCVLYHRSSIDVDELTIEEKVVRTADALSHYWRVEHLWQEGIREAMTPDETKDWLVRKFEKDWGKIMPQIKIPARNPVSCGPSAKELYTQALNKINGFYADAIANEMLAIAQQISQAN